MTESAFTTKLLKALRQHPALRDKAAIIKHANPYHRGVPDFSISIGRATWWYEVKRWGEKPTKIQRWHLDRMAGSVITIKRDGAVVTPVESFGLMSMEELVEELVSRCQTGG